MRGLRLGLGLMRGGGSSLPPYTGPVATGTYFPTNDYTTGSLVGLNGYTPHWATDSITSLQLVWVNATANTIGGTAAGAGNVISGNVQHGVLIQGGANAQNVIAGNLIGTSANGTADLGNTLSGVLVSGAASNTIGGIGAATRNVVSGNDQSGVLVSGATATGSSVVVAPSFIAKSRRYLIGSITITCPAPVTRPACTTPSPTGPAPNTTTSHPG